jgi:hypothetical protein
MKLIEDLKKCKQYRKEYRIKPTLNFRIDREYYFSFLPTILWTPWVYRYPNTCGVVDIWWLNFHILIGTWERLSCRDCKHQEECVKSKRLEWYFDDVFEKGEKCSEFEAKYYV